MQHNRNIRISIKEHISSALESPGVGGPGAYNVYGENNLPQNNPSFTPNFPYIYIVDGFIQPTKMDLPLIIVDVGSITFDTVEIGLLARTASVNLWVYGQNRGVRDDIASYLQTWLATSGSGNVITVRNYGVAGNPELDKGEVQTPVSVYAVTDVPEYQRVEASMRNSNVVTFNVRFKAK